MNTTSNDILRFLDGSLTGEDEAELLHRLSVSPERRETLRSHIQQAEMFDRDRAAINVPYTAEQKLWTRLSEMMPAPPPAPPPFITTAATVASQVAKQPRVSSWLVVSGAALIGLLIGFGSGFFAAKETTPSLAAVSSVAVDRSNTTNGTNRSFSSNNTSRVFAEKEIASEAPHARTYVPSVAFVPEPIQPVVSTQEETQNISSASAIAMASNNDLYIRDPREETAYRFNPLHAENKQPRSVLQRFDILVNEALGMQTPNTIATKVSFPVVTNSIISLSYQVFADENFYVGAALGSTNMAKKNITLSNDIGPMDYTLTTDVNHTQTAWYGGFVQYRLPVSDRFAFTSTAGVSASSLGLILSGELGSRIDLTDQVGLALGLRISDLQYSLDKEYADILMKQNNRPPTGIVGNVSGSQHSQNYELTAGMYFHF